MSKQTPTPNDCPAGFDYAKCSQVPGCKCVERVSSPATVVVTDPDILTIKPPSTGEAVIRIAPDGRLFWRGREVETDADYRAAMVECMDYLTGRKAPQSETGWISVKDKKPADGRKRLVFDGRLVKVVDWHPDWWNTGTCTVTHWMDLPEAPK